MVSVAGAGTDRSRRGAGTKACLEALDYCQGNEKGFTVEFLFNPSKLSISRNINWTSSTDDKGVDLPKTEFVSGGPRTLSMELFIDTYETGGDAREFVKKLELLTLVDSRNVKKDKKKEPPKVLFRWGQITFFPAVIKSLNVTYTLFHEDGLPARATVNLSLQEVKTENPHGRQNPTSGGDPDRSSHLVLPGETLDLIAYHELGDSRHWRHIAEINALDNPFDLKPGRWLVISPVR